MSVNVAAGLLNAGSKGLAKHLGNLSMGHLGIAQEIVRGEYGLRNTYAKGAIDLMKSGKHGALNQNQFESNSTTNNTGMNKPTKTVASGPNVSGNNLPRNSRPMNLPTGFAKPPKKNSAPPMRSSAPSMRGSAPSMKSSVPPMRRGK
jgi:hypothetical protein